MRILELLITIAVLWRIWFKTVYPHEIQRYKEIVENDEIRTNPKPKFSKTELGSELALLNHPDYRKIIYKTFNSTFNKQ